MIKTFFKTLLSMIFIMGIMAGVYYTLLTTETGVRAVIWLGTHRLPGELKYTGLKGNFLDKVQIKEVTYKNKDTTVTVNKFKFELDYHLLFKRQLPLKILAARDAKIVSGANTISFNDINLKNDPHSQIEIPHFLLTAKMTRPLDRNIVINISGNWRQFSATLKPIELPLPLEWFKNKVHPELVLHTKAMLSATINTSFTSKSQLLLTLQLKPGIVKLPIDHKVQTFFFKGGLINANVTNKSISGEVDIRFIEDSVITGKLSLPKLTSNLPLTQQQLKGKIHWHFTDISFLSAFIDNIGTTHGDLSVNFDITGTLEQPIITGSSKLKSASFKIPSLHTTIENLELTAKAIGQQLDYTASAKVGDGQLNLQGSTDISKAGLPTELRLTGNNATIINNDDIRINASPDIQINYSNNQLRLSGKIHVPSANIEPKDFSSTSTLPEDVVIVDSTKKTKSQTPLQLSSNINLTLGDHVKLKTMGVTGNIHGKLSINDAVNQPTMAQGELTISNGVYEKYSTKLTIPKGKFIYTGGPINNPGLNIEAVRKFNQPDSFGGDEFNQPLTAGVRITGTLQHPTIKLFSNPSRRNQSDTLAYLITGQSIGQATASQGELLLQAASAIDFGGEGKLSNIRKDIKDKLGLSELGLDSEETFDKKNNRINHHTSLVLGKYLSPKLYVKYSFDILDHTPKVKINYSLNKHWSVQTENTTTGSGVDLLYSIERK